MTKRSICISENGRAVFRYDVNKHTQSSEYDMFKALIDMEKAGIVDVEKLGNMIKVHFGLGIVDSTKVLVSALKNDGKWNFRDVRDEENMVLSDYQNLGE
jgi:hypothetical protein